MSNHTILLHFKYLSETKGTHRYTEIDHHGEIIKIADATIGVIYVRKSALPNGKAPQWLTVAVEMHI